NSEPDRTSTPLEQQKTMIVHLGRAAPAEQDPHVEDRDDPPADADQSAHRWTTAGETRERARREDLAHPRERDREPDLVARENDPLRPCWRGRFRVGRGGEHRHHSRSQNRGNSLGGLIIARSPRSGQQSLIRRGGLNPTRRGPIPRPPRGPPAAAPRIASVRRYADGESPARRRAGTAWECAGRARGPRPGRAR